jgi:hypothetical protein
VESGYAWKNKDTMPGTAILPGRDGMLAHLPAPSPLAREDPLPGAAPGPRPEALPLIMLISSRFGLPILSVPSSLGSQAGASPATQRTRAIINARRGLRVRFFEDDPPGFVIPALVFACDGEALRMRSLTQQVAGRAFNEDGQSQPGLRRWKR